MSTDERLPAESAATTSGPNLVNESIRFLRIVRRKLPTLTACMILGAIIGTAWYVTATRKFESSSEIMVLKTESNVLEGSNSSNHRTIQDNMPNYQRVLSSDEVLTEAIKRLPKEHRIDLKGVPKAKWTGEIRKNLSVSSPRQTSLLQVRFVSRNPKTAAFVVNAIVESYLSFMRKIHKSDSKESLELLSREESRIGAELQAKERELTDLKRETGILIQGDEHFSHFIIQQTVKLNDALVEAQQKTLEAKALVASVQNALEQGADLQSFLQQAASDVSREFMMREMGINSSDAYTVAKREDDLLTDQTQLQTMLKTYGPNHPQIIRLQTQIQQTKKWLAERSQVVSTTMKQVRERELGPKLLEIVQQRLFQATAHERAISLAFENMQGQAIALNDKMAQIEILEANLRRQRQYYEDILEKIAKVDIGANSGLKISVTNPATPSLGPVAPKITTTIVLCIMLGAIAGMAAIYVMDMLDDRFRSPDELQWQLGLPMLAMIREMEPLEGKGLDSVATFAKSDCLESEAFRTLRSSLTFANDETRRLVFTSTEPGDGKTTTLANLAVAFAQSKKKTLVIDADLRRPGMTQLLDLKGSRGLSTILRESKPIGESCLENIFNLGIDNLDVMPSGPRPANPSELLASERFNDIIAWAETLYDQILVDAPPVLAVTDPAIIGRVVDGAVVVIRPDRNRRKMVLRAVESYRATGVHVVGIVANHIAVESESEYGYGYGYGYGHGYGHDQQPDDHPADAEAAIQAYEPEPEARIAA